MTLLTPALAIAGACAIAIPILIHLLMRQRRRPIEWAAMRFLIEAFKKHKRRLQLEQLLLLAVRCLILGLLGLALARPLIEGTTIIEQGGSRRITLVIDDGLASGALGDDTQPALRHHIEQAVEVVRTLGPGDTVSVISAARPARALLSPPSSDHTAVIDLLQSLAPRQSPSDLTGAMAFIKEAASDAQRAGQQAAVYLFSDFRAGSAPLESPLPSTGIEAGGDIKLFASPPASDPIANTQVVALEPVRSMIIAKANDGSGQVKVRLVRSGGQLTGDVTRVRLTGEGLLAIEPRVIQWQPGQSEADAEFMIDFGLTTDRKVALSASIEADALDADNQRQVVLDLRSQVRVLLIDRRSFGFERTIDQLTAGQWIRRALEPLEGGPITIVEAEPAALDIADLRTADVAILPRPDLLAESAWRLLRQFVDRGGLLILTPPAEVNVHQWSTHLASTLALPWQLSMEVVEHPEGMTLAAEQRPSEILRLISSDLGEMVRPILTYRVLPVDASAEASGQRLPTENSQNTDKSESDSSVNATAHMLLRFADGSPLLIVGSPAAASAAEPVSAPGVVLYLAVAPEVAWTNLPTKPLMVPLLHEMVRQGLSVIRASQKAEVGDQPALALAGAAARDLRSPAGRMIPLTRSGGGVRPQEPLDAAGVYEVVDEARQNIGLLAVNVDAKAGVTDVQSAAAVESWLAHSGPWATFDPENLARTLGSAASGSPLAGVLLLVVLALVLLETVLARWFSHAYRRESEADRAGIRPSMGGIHMARSHRGSGAQEAAA